MITRFLNDIDFLEGVILGVCAVMAVAGAVLMP